MPEIKILKELTSSLTVLYVEDDTSIAHSFKYYLEKIFKKVDYFENGKEALDSYIKNKYDIVITDIQMPIMDGLEMSKKIKEINKEQNILITSAYNDNEKSTRAIKLGIDGYIIKPIDYTELNTLLYQIAIKIKKLEEEH